MGICLHQSKHFAWPHGRKSEGKAKEKERKIKEREKENGRKYSAKNLWSVHPISPTKHCLVSSHVYIKLTKQFDALFNTSNQTDNLHNCIQDHHIIMYYSIHSSLSFNQTHPKCLWILTGLAVNHFQPTIHSSDSWEINKHVLQRDVHRHTSLQRAAHKHPSLCRATR